MTGFEYKVVPAPTRGLKAKGVKTTPDRFANALQTVMNDLGAEGWEYQRTDTLPVEERQGLTGKTTSFQNMLVFRRALEPQIDDAPEIAALIENQSVAIEEIPEPPAPPAPVEDIAERTDASNVEDVPENAPSETDEAPAAVAAQDRVSDTLEAPFAFPWNKRRATAPIAKDDDKHFPAE